jgi:regulatory protein
MSMPAMHPERIRQRLRGKALRYLTRYAASRARVARVLGRYAAKLAAAESLEPGACAAEIDPVLDELVRLGLIDDEGYAGARARRLVARGMPIRLAGGRLRAEGLAEDAVETALARLGQEMAEPDLAAAAAFARRRRLGPWRDPDGRASAFRQDLVKLCRAGFDQQTARRVLAAATPDDLLAEAESA